MSGLKAIKALSETLPPARHPASVRPSASVVASPPPPPPEMRGLRGRRGRPGAPPCDSLRNARSDAAGRGGRPLAGLPAEPASGPGSRGRSRPPASAPEPLSRRRPDRLRAPSSSDRPAPSAAGPLAGLRRAARRGRALERRPRPAASARPRRALAAAALLALPLLAGLAPAAQAQTTLVSNTGQPLSITTGNQVAVAFTTGSNGYGYTLSAVDIPLRQVSGRGTVVTIRAGGGANPGAIVATLANPSSFTPDALNTFTAPAGTTLAASTTYFLVVNDGRNTQSSNVELTVTTSNAQTGAAGWSIADAGRFVFNGNWINGPGIGTSIRFALKGAPNGPAAPTGFTATPGPGSGQVTLRWTASDDSRITSYQWDNWRGTPGAWGGWRNFSPGAGPGATGGRISGLVNGDQYGFRVRARAGALEGAASDAATATPLANPPLPKPTGLTATAGDGQVVLSWDNLRDSRITRYQFRARESGGSWQNWISIGGSNANTTTYTVTGLLGLISLINGTTYDFQIRARNTALTGAASDIVSATPTAPPAKPTGLTATAGNQQVTLRWNDPSNAAITKYQYRQRPAGGSWGGWTDFVSPNDATTTEKAITGLTNGTEYSFQIRAVAGTVEGTASDPVSGTPIRPPARPTGLTATTGDASGEVDLNWTDPGDDTITSYDYRIRSGGAWETSPIPGSDADTTSHTVTGLTDGTEYTFQIFAKAGSVFSPSSASATATPLNPAGPAKPTGLTATAGNRVVTLRWTNPNNSDITGWQYRQGTGDPLSWGSWTNFAGSFTDATLTRVITGLTNGTEYSFEIRAVAGTVEGTASDPVSGTPIRPPARPTGLTATTGDASGEVDLNWTDPGDDTITSYDYRIRSGSAWNTFPIPGSDADTTSHTVTGLTDGTEYTFQIFAKVGSVFSPSSASATATPMAPPPAKPTGLTAAPGPGSGQVTLRWTDPGDSRITRWQWDNWRGTPGVWGGWRNMGGAAGRTSFTRGGLDNGTQYGWRIRACAGSACGAASDAATATPAANPPPLKPTGLTATAGPGGGQVTLSWDDPKDSRITHWQWRYRARGGSWPPAWSQLPAATVPDFNFISSGLTNGTAYEFQIRAVAGSVRGPASDTVSATPTAPPAKPTGLAAEAGDRRVELSWDDPSNSAITKYQYRRGTGDPVTWGEWTDSSNSRADTTSIILSGGLANGTEYSFQIRAVAGTLTGAASDTVTATPMAPSAQFRTASTQVTEQDILGSIFLDIAPAPSAPITLAYTVAGTATRGSDGDFTLPASDSVAVPAGRGAVFIQIGLTEDALREPDETVILTLADGAGYDLGARTTHTLTIEDDDPPLAPAGFAAAAGDGQVVLSWDDPSDAAISGYQFRQRTPPDTGSWGSWTAIASSTAATTTHTVTGLTNGTAYGFQVRALDGTLEGAASSEATATPAAATAGVTTATTDGEATEGSTTDTATFTVVLNTQPSGGVAVAVTAPAGLELSTGGTFASSAQIGFTNSFWSTPQTVTVRATDDSTDSPLGRELSVTYTTSSQDSNYRTFSGTAATVTVADNDPTAVTLAGAAGDVAEGGTKDFTVTLGRGLVNGEVLPVPLTFGGEATRGTDYTTACPTTLPTGVACANLDSGNAAVTFTGPSTGTTATTVTLTLTAATDGTTESGGETVVIGLGTLNANSGTGLGGGASGADSLADFRITDAAAAPAAPTGFTAAAGPGGGQITLSWTPPSGTVTGYQYRVRRPGGGWFGWANMAGGGNITTFTGDFTEVLDFQMRARNGSLFGAPSAIVRATPVAAPAAPTGFAAAAGPGGGQVTLSWSDPSNSDIAKYQHRRKLSSAGAWGSWTDFAGGTTAASTGGTVAGLTNGAAYDFQVRATAAPGGTVLGAASAAATATPRAPALVLDPASLTVAEGGSGAYTVALATRPTATVTVTVAGASGEVTFDTDSATPGNQSTLTFSTTTWSAPRTVAVSAGEDGDTANDSATLTHSASGGGYGSVTGSVAVTVTDNDAPGLVLDPTSLTVAEGGSATYTVALATRPTGNVTVTVAGASGEVTFDTDSAANGDQSTLTFTTATWGTAQTVAVSAGQDNDTADDSATLTHSASGGGYGSATGSVAVTVDDDDAPAPAKPEGFKAEAGNGQATLSWTDPGNSDITGWEYWLHGRWRPVPGSGAGTTSHVVSGLSNRVAYTFRVRAAAGEVKGAASDRATATPSAPPLALSVSSLEVAEGGEASYTVRLGAAPSGPVQVWIISDNPDVTTDPAALDFTRANWDMARTVTVKAARDDDDAADAATLAHTATGGGQEGAGDGVVVAVSVTGDAGAPPSAPVDPTPSDPAPSDPAPSDPTPSDPTPSDPTPSDPTPSDPPPPANAAPAAAAAIPDQSAAAGEAFSYAVPDDAFSDADGDPLTYSASLAGGGPLPAWLSFDPASRAFSGTPGPSDAGVLAVRVAADDGRGGSASAVFEIVVAAPAAPPAVSVRAGPAAAEGGEALFTVAAEPPPAGRIAVSLEVSATGDFAAAGALGPRSVELTPSRPSAAVAVATVDDMRDEPDGAVALALRPGPGYALGAPASAAVAVADDDEPSLIVSASSLALEEGGGASYAVSLGTEPPGPVTVSVAVSEGAGVEVSPASLSFTADDWSMAQTVTVSALEDDDIADQSGSLVHAASGGGYGGVSAEVAVAVADDDEPSLAVSRTSLPLEEGAGAAYTVALGAEPSGPVAVSVAASEGAGVEVSPSSLSFTADNWSMPQSVAVSALDDDDIADESGSLTHAASGGGYGGVSAEVAVMVDDNDEPSLIVPESSLSLAEGAGAAYTVALGAEPSGPVAVSVAASEGAGVEVSPSSLSFTADNWSMPQSVAVSALEDDDIADESGALIHTASGGGYGGVSAEVAVMVDDNDEPSLIVPESSLSLAEGAGAAYTVALGAEPSGPVAVSVAASEGAGVEVSPSSLSFTADNWSMPQSVAVSALEDDDIADESGALIHTASGGGYGGVSAEVAVMVDDNDEPSLIVPESSLSLAEGAGAAYTVALGAEPSGPVAVSVAASEGAGVEVSPSSLSFTADNWSMPQSVAVSALDDDDIADESGALIHTASGGGYGGVSAEVAVMVDDNDEPSAAGAAGAWMPRFGRVASEQILEGIGGRVASLRGRAAMRPEDAANGDGGAGFEAALAGRALSAYGPFLGGSPGGGFAGGGPGTPAARPGAGASPALPALGAGGYPGAAAPSAAFPPAAGARGGRPSGGALRAALADSSFSAGGRTAGGSSWGLWGRGSLAAFEGRSAGGTAVDGDVATGQAGADWSSGPLLLGLSASYSRGEGGYAAAGGGRGSTRSSMAALAPYAALDAGRFSAWGAFGAGRGGMSLSPEGGAEAEADIGMEMGAAGLRGGLADLGGGWRLSLAADAMAARFASEEAPGLPEAEARTSRARAAVEASWTRALAGGGEFSARLEGGARHDGGDAERGWGAEVSAGLSWARGGLAFGIEGRHLAAHEDGGFSRTGASARLDWDCGPGGLGPSASLRRRWGIAAASGLDQLFAMRRMGQFGAESGAGGLDAELGWGLALPGGRFLATPFLLHGAQAGGSMQTLGWRLDPRGPDGRAAGARMAVKLARGGGGNGGLGILIEARLGF